MDVLLMTDEQILELGFKALVDKLGPVGWCVLSISFKLGKAITPKNGSNGSECLMLKHSLNRSNRLKSTLSVLPKPLKL